jgi:hypothetical protein
MHDDRARERSDCTVLKPWRYSPFITVKIIWARYLAALNLAAPNLAALNLAALNLAALNLAALGELADVLCSAESQRLDGHGRLPSARGHKARSIAQKKIRHIVRAVIFIDH